jgi:hypothetical protein
VDGVRFVKEWTMRERKGFFGDEPIIVAVKMFFVVLIAIAVLGILAGFLIQFVISCHATAHLCDAPAMAAMAIWYLTVPACMVGGFLGGVLSYIYARCRWE